MPGDDPRTYGPRRFGRELLIALLILGFGVPLVLLALPAADRPAADRADAALSGLQLQAFTGNGLTEGTVLGAGVRLGWSTAAAVEPGAGIARASLGSTPLAALVRDGAVDPRDDVILVQGGEGDVGVPRTS